ncbi:hypothetical protein AB0G15_42035, partial [Streptosporangium sp. NPDC023825]|uniref:hypothetical protein n=1 Tax=Streptosporangium sp. NPDC023825 TaxID=3154909 RepID=UPI00341C9E9E
MTMIRNALAAGAMMASALIVPMAMPASSATAGTVAVTTPADATSVLKPCREHKNPDRCRARREYRREYQRERGREDRRERGREYRGERRREGMSERRREGMSERRREGICDGRRVGVCVGRREVLRVRRGVGLCGGDRGG